MYDNEAIRIDLYNSEGRSWDEYVISHPLCTNYHQYAWRKIIENSFGHQSYYLVAKEHGESICGILPLVHVKSKLFGSNLVSLPFFNYGGPLCNQKSAEDEIMNGAKRILENLSADLIEFRNLDNFQEGLTAREHKVSMILNLEIDEDAQWRALNAKVRNQVRKAQRSGLTTVIGHLELLDGFYEVFCRNMRDLGTPVYGKVFFRNILETFPESTRIVSVMFKGETVASALLTWFRDSLEVPWASSVREHRDKCPNNLLYWEAIRFAIVNGSRKFDFGRSTPEEGTYRFKKQWGAKPVQLYWQYLVDQGKNIPELNPGNPKYRMAIKVWQKMPVALTKIVGPHIVRNIP